MMFRPGEIVKTRRHCGTYVMASKVLALPARTLQAESLVIVLDRHDAVSALQAQTMVEILHHDEILIVDERHLQPCNGGGGMV